MELGIDRQQLESARALGRRIVDDPVLLRFVVCVALLLLGWLLVLEPQAEALAKARRDVQAEAGRARMAQELRFFESEKQRYEPRFFASADIVEWQRYVLDELALSGARLRSLEQPKTEAKGNFKVLELALDATGTYAQLADFIDRLERGQRVVRVSQLRIERRKDDIIMECVLNALVRPAGAGREAPVLPVRDGAAPGPAGPSTDRGPAGGDERSAPAVPGPASPGGVAPGEGP